MARATLRAPPSKWAIEAFFPESPCRVLSLVLSFASKESTSPSGRQPHHPRRSRRVNPSSGKGGLRLRAPKRLSSGQTIGAARTAVRSACCLPERPVANRLRRLYPLDDGELFKFNLKSSVCQRQTGLPKGNPPCVFPSFPFGNLRAPKVARKPMDGNPAVRTEVGAPDPCKGPLRSIVFPGPISPMESLPPFLDIPLFGAPTPRCRIAFFSFFSFAAESKRSPPSSRLNPAPFWYVFSVGNPRLRKRSGTTFRSGFSLFFFLN